MTLRARRILFVVFVLIFLISTPGVLFYAAGYSVDWENGRLIKTGAFYFDSLPQEATISVNGKLDNSTPAFLSRLVPGQYFIQISKAGFVTWQKNLDVQEQITTEARHILLIPEEPKTNFITSTTRSTKEYFLAPAQKSALAQVSKIATSTLTNFSSYAVFGNNLYFLHKQTSILWRADLNGIAREQISSEPLASSSQPHNIIISPGQVAVFTLGGKLFLLNKDNRTFQFLADNVQGAEFSADNEKLLWWTDNELWVYWLKDVFSQPYRKAGEKELVVRHPDKITQAVWFEPTDEHIIYSVVDILNSAKIEIVELDNRDQRNVYQIWETKKPEIYWNRNDDLFYILSEEKLYSVDLLNAASS